MSFPNRGGTRAVITGLPTVGSVLTASLTGTATATAYQWTRNGSAISGATSSTYTVQTADRGASIGVSITSAIGATVAVPATVPAAPTGVSAVAGNAQVTGSFTAPTDNGGSAITGYQMAVYRASDNVLLGTVSGSASPLTLTGLTNGVAVYIKVAAVNAVGVGAQSAASANVTPAAVVMRAVSDRIYLNQYRSASAKYMGGYRTDKIGTAVAALEAEFANWFVDGFGGPTQTYAELGSGGPVNWTASVEYPAGTFTQFKTAGGSATLTLADGAQGTMYATVSIPENTEVKIHFLQAQTGSGFVVHMGGTTSSGTAGTSTTSTNIKDTLRASATAITDATMTGNWAAAGGSDASGNACGPIRISGLTAQAAVLILGTSIDHGEGGTELTVYNSGLACQQLSNAKMGFTNGGIRGDSVNKFLTNSTKRQALGNSSYYTHILFGGPVNDVLSTANRTAAQIFADMRAQWALFPGKKLIQQTMTPLATDSTGQTPIARAQVWRDVNDLIRGNTDGVIVFEVARAMEVAGTPETCQWITTTSTVDGTHPNNSGYDINRASGSINTSLIIP